MCFLKITSDSISFKPIVLESSIPVFSVFDKGENRSKAKRRVCDKFQVSFDVSDKEWNEFPEQIKDAISFLKEYRNELKEIFKKVSDADGYLDFPIYSRLSDEIVNQNDHLPKELICLAGELNLGIEVAIYAKNSFD